MINGRNDNDGRVDVVEHGVEVRVGARAVLLCSGFGAVMADVMAGNGVDRSQAGEHANVLTPQSTDSRDSNSNAHRETGVTW
jgi:hypothetical protein